MTQLDAGLDKTPTLIYSTPQIALPFEMLPSGKVREVEQDTLDEIAMSVETILRYRVGDRVELPTFGSPEPLFRESSEEISSVLAEAVSRWEDRAHIFIEERPGQWGDMVRSFMVRIEGGTDNG